MPLSFFVEIRNRGGGGVGHKGEPGHGGDPTASGIQAFTAFLSCSISEMHGISVTVFPQRIN